MGIEGGAPMSEMPGVGVASASTSSVSGAVGVVHVATKRLTWAGASLDDRRQVGEWGTQEGQRRHEEEGCARRCRSASTRLARLRLAPGR